MSLLHFSIREVRTGSRRLLFFEPTTGTDKGELLLASQQGLVDYSFSRIL